MQNKVFQKNLFVVVFSRMISLASAVAVGFLLPRLLSVTDYGYYKVFTLYAAYTALLHFGFVDGILLKISGKEYRELNLLTIRAYTQFFIVFQLFISLTMMLAGCFFASGEYCFIVLMLSFNMLFVNITTYFQFVSQAVQRFGEYSAKNIIISITKMFFVVVLLIIRSCCSTNVSYRVYLIGLNILDLLIAMWYIVIYKDITFGTRESIKTVSKDIVSLFRSGIVLTLAYQVAHLILALDRQFVNMLFTTDDFAVYSFAYNIVSMVSTMVSSISIVLLPMLKNRTREAVVQSYKVSLFAVSMIAAAALLLYFPLTVFIEWFLPEYITSVEYVAIVLPAFTFTALVTVVMFTTDKVLDMHYSFFKDGCIILCLGLLTNLLAYVFWGSRKAISFASLLVMMVWFLITGVRLKKITKVGIRRVFVYLIVISAGFLLIVNLIQDTFIGLLLYFILLITWTSVFYKEALQELVGVWKRLFVHK